MSLPASFRPLTALALAAVLGASGPASAKDLGVRGATWPIAEPDLLEEIEARLGAMQRSGELARIERQAQTRARSRLEEPDPVPGIALAGLGRELGELAGATRWQPAASSVKKALRQAWDQDDANKAERLLRNLVRRGWRAAGCSTRRLPSNGTSGCRTER